MLRSIVSLTCTAVLAGQVQTTAHVQASPVGAFGNVAPLGCNPTGLFAEARSQILIPARYLPGPGAVLLGLGALGTSSAGTNTSLTYGSLRVTVSRTAATSLQPAFAGNLPQPQVLMAVNDLRVDWRAGEFTPITFVNTYTHDGTSALVIDIQKVVSPVGDASMKTIQNARRTDLPRMINAFGGPGSNAHLAATATATANAPMSMELRWAGPAGSFTPTVKLRSDPASPLRAQFAIGRPVETIVQGAPGSLFATFESATAFAAPVAIPGVVGQLWLANPMLLQVGVLPAAGQSSMTQTIPDDPALVNLYLGFQALLAEQLSLRASLTNLADCIVTDGV
jgi:hypothetical protein